MNEDTFRTSYQLEQALWGALSARLADDRRGHKPPPVYLNRIKRLLELDTKEAANIFAVKPASGSGNVAAYSPFGVFLMALALVFLDAGLGSQTPSFCFATSRQS